jgi:hypothetical protein
MRVQGHQLIPELSLHEIDGASVNCHFA